MSHNPHNLQPGQIVVLDKDFHNSIEVKIISFSPLGMYANVLPVGGTIPYPVMSDRLSPKKQMDKIEAPFSNEQVKSLNDYQQERIFHPFTCDRKSPECETKTNPDDVLADGVLIATTEGWVCPCGKYKQNWAHSFMTGIRLK